MAKSSIPSCPPIHLSSILCHASSVVQTLSRVRRTSPTTHWVMWRTSESSLGNEGRCKLRDFSHCNDSCPGKPPIQSGRSFSWSPLLNHLSQGYAMIGTDSNRIVLSLTKPNQTRVFGDHSKRGFRGIRQLLLLIYMATTGGFPGIPVRNGRKEHVANHLPPMLSAASLLIVQTAGLAKSPSTIAGSNQSVRLSSPHVTPILNALRTPGLVDVVHRDRDDPGLLAGQ